MIQQIAKKSISLLIDPNLMFGEKSLEEVSWAS